MLKPYDPSPAVVRLKGGCAHVREGMCEQCVSDALREAYWSGVESSCFLADCRTCAGAGFTASGRSLSRCSECNGCGKAVGSSKKL